MSVAIEDRASLEFVLALRRAWAADLYPAVKRQFERSGARGDPRSIAPAVHALPAYPWFSWLERGSQKMLWRAVADAIEHRGETLPEPGAGPSVLEIDPDFRLPDWYTEWDIHVQPGGIWSSAEAALVYERGARLVMLGDNDDYKFHRLFTETAIPARDYRRIVDLGCGFGKSAWPLKQRFPQAEVIGIDLSAPCLRLAAARANARGLALRLRQADAVATGLEEGSADLVTSTMFVHEIPAQILPAIFAEAARLLAPGGVLRFLDFQFTGDAFRDLAMIEHGARNNEPFLPSMMREDLAQMARDAGLTAARWTAFDERGAGRLTELAWPDRPEWHFPWAVLEAEKTT
jgi:ubiquinone/menaquinone biosynthesis C-methylase UbiE